MQTSQGCVSLRAAAWLWAAAEISGLEKSFLVNGPNCWHVGWVSAAKFCWLFLDRFPLSSANAFTPMSEGKCRTIKSQEA